MQAALTTRQCAELHTVNRALQARIRINHFIPTWLDILVDRKRESIPQLAADLVASAGTGVGKGRGKGPGITVGVELLCYLRAAVAAARSCPRTWVSPASYIHLYM